MTKTNHSVKIEAGRSVADSLERAWNVTHNDSLLQDAVALRAAADLLEMHDSARFNLHKAPNLRIFVQMTLGGKVLDNGA